MITFGQLGSNAPHSQTMVRGVAGASLMAAGRAHTCAVTGPRTVLCWDDNSFGRLGNGTFTRSATPLPAEAVR